jgi:phosphoribosylamine-glycine ligase
MAAASAAGAGCWRWWPRPTTFDTAFEQAYAGLSQVHFEGMTYRRDIGHQVRSR